MLNKFEPTTIQPAVIRLQRLRVLSDASLNASRRQQFVFGELPSAIVRAGPVNSRALCLLWNVRRKSFAWPLTPQFTM